MIRRPPRSTPLYSSAASDVYKRQARLYLEYQGALSNQIIVPLDAHTDLYRSTGEADDLNDAISLQRTDLALFDLNLAERTITCNLVEVKCYSQVGDFSAFNQLKERI